MKTDDPDEPTVRLLLTVNIPEILKINPRFVYWKTGDKPEPKIIQLTVPGEHHVKISGIKSSRTVFDATLVSQTSTNYEIRVTPATTAQPANGKITIMTSVDSTSSRQFEIFTRIIPLEDCWLEKETRWSGRILWLDSQLKDDFYCDECHMPDALYLNQAEWNAQIEAVINAWSPGTPTVVYCVSGCRSSAVTARLGEYGLQGLFFIVRSQ